MAYGGGGETGDGVEGRCCRMLLTHPSLVRISSCSCSRYCLIPHQWRSWLYLGSRFLEASGCFPVGFARRI